MKSLALALVLLAPALTGTADKLPAEGLLLDLDAGKGITLEDGNHVATWKNQAPGAVAVDFVKRDEGRKVAGSGRPTLRKDVKELAGHSSLVFRQGELVNMKEDAFDGLTTGKGFTWFAVIAVYEQRVGLKDVNTFFGNIKNGGNYEGLWANVKDDNSLWTGGRNGITFGRFDQNNPLILGPKLERNRYYLVASRMAPGTGEQVIELFLNSPKPVATGKFPVNPKANPSRMVVGQERDAIQHPGQESFDGEIARLLVYERALDDKAFASALATLRKLYAIREDAR